MCQTLDFRIQRMACLIILAVVCGASILQPVNAGNIPLPLGIFIT